MADQHHQAWWRSAAIYQIYLRSFADGNGDGVGDLPGSARQPAVPGRPRRRRDLDQRRGIRRRMADGGYDVADYRAIDPLFGTLRRGRDADRGGARRSASASSSTSSPTTAPTQHAWFQEALASAPGSPDTRPVLVPPGPRRARRPAAERLAVHLRRPGLDPRIRRRRRVVPAPVRPRAARLQLGQPGGPRGVRGHAAVLVRPRRRRHPHRLGRPAREGPALPTSTRRPAGTAPVHRPRRGPRRLPRAGGGSPTATTPPRALIGEVWLPDHERFALYLRPDELHTAFNFDFLGCPWDAAALRHGDRRRRSTLHAPVGAPADLGAVQPRRHPPRHPLRPRATHASP